jgi:hypothetical protein
MNAYPSLLSFALGIPEQVLLFLLMETLVCMPPFAPTTGFGRNDA